MDKLDEKIRVSLPILGILTNLGVSLKEFKLAPSPDAPLDLNILVHASAGTIKELSTGYG